MMESANFSKEIMLVEKAVINECGEQEAYQIVEPGKEAILSYETQHKIVKPCEEAILPHEFHQQEEYDIDQPNEVAILSDEFQHHELYEMPQRGGEAILPHELQQHEEYEMVEPDGEAILPHELQLHGEYEMVQPGGKSILPHELQHHQEYEMAGGEAILPHELQHHEEYGMVPSSEEDNLTREFQNYTIADNVVIEHIELAEGECAETGMSLSQESQTRRSVIDSWTDTEKRQFLNAIQMHGTQNIENIANEISTRTVKEVKEASDCFRMMAEGLVACTAKKFTTRKVKKRPECKTGKGDGNPLSEWLHVLNASLAVDDLQTVTGHALRMIAESEYMPEPRDACNVEFRKLYLALADALEGRPLPNMSDESYEMLKRALTHVSLSTKQLAAKGGNEHVRSLIGRNLNSVFLGRELSNTSGVCPLKYQLSNLIKNKPYNPLLIPMELLDFISEESGNKPFQPK